MIKIDLHTHSVFSPDGSISVEQYRKVLDNGTLDCIAVTDHNRIDFAVMLHEQLGQEKIVVGEEISTSDGEIIGLFLTSKIEPQQDAEATIRAIKAQGGLVYIPHPFETVRSGISEEVLNRIKESVDVVESPNGRAYFQNFGPKAYAWAHMNRVPTAASSDAHRAGALGKTYTIIEKTPNASNLAELLITARKKYGRPSVGDLTAPKLNRLKKITRRHR